MSITERLARLIKNKTTLSYGVEISDGAVRLAGVPVESARKVPCALHEIPLGYTPDSLQAINAGPEMKQALRSLVQHFGIKDVHVGIPERHFFFRCIQVPALSGSNQTAELHALIDDYLATKVVLPRRDVVCEYDIVAEADGLWYVAIAVVPKYIIRRYQALLEMSGLRPLSIQANIHAMRMSCIEDLAYGMSMSIRIDETNAHVAIMNGPTVFADRDLVLPETPEKTQRFVLNEVRRMYHDWIQQPYKHKLEREAVGSITLFGGSRDLELLRQQLAREMNMPVKIANPIRSTIEQHDLDYHPPVHSDHMHRYSAAIGLALLGK